ncbi:hypothetical protein V1517DRAFT_339941 [Lipomyces orientalis]|uniref:Uncharacterized protein n=1 Tax=Lipomyces orientalis TaxID=1233043 RepID=A0ACC3TKB3_9ASCO
MVNLGSDDSLYNVMDSFRSRLRTFHDLAAAGIEGELFLTDFPPALFDRFVDWPQKEAALPVDEVYDSLHHTLYLSTITCDVGEELCSHVANKLVAKLNSIGLASKSGFPRDRRYSSAVSFFHRSRAPRLCHALYRSGEPYVGETGMIGYHQTIDCTGLSSNDHLSNVLLNFGYIRNYDKLMTKTKLLVGDKRLNKSTMMVLILVDESPTFQMPEVVVNEQLDDDELDRFEEMLGTYDLQTPELLSHIEYDGHCWFGELRACFLDVYRYYPDSESVALIRRIDCMCSPGFVTGAEVIDIPLSDSMSPEHISLLQSVGDEAPIVFHLDREELLKVCNRAIQDAALGRFTCYGGR